MQPKDNHKNKTSNSVAYVVRQPGTALAASLLSTLLFVLCSSRLGIAWTLGLPWLKLYVCAHLLGGYGLCSLLWGLVSVPEPDTGRRNLLLCGAVVTVGVYHAVAAAAYALSFPLWLYYAVSVMWWVKTIGALFIAFDFFVCRDVRRAWAGAFLILYSAAGAPYYLPGILGLMQWGIAKVAAIALAIQLYRCMLQK